MNKIIYISVLVSLLSLFTACDTGEPDSERSSGTASVRVNISVDGIEGRTVRPAMALQDVTKWELRGGKSGAAKALLDEFTSATGTVVNLETGTWDFSLMGFKDELLILSGTITGRTIYLNNTNTLSFTVTPTVNGNGTVNIVVKLPAGSGVTEARVFWDEEELEPPLAPEDDTIALTGDYPAGAYSFSIRLYKGAELYGTVSESVYVWANLESEKTYTLEKEDVKAVYDEGVYIGIITFAGEATDITSEVPILLDEAGRTRLINKLNSNYTIAGEEGTAIFYSVHRALANLKKRENRWPEALHSVNVVTFTDGLDNGSTGASLDAPIENRPFSSLAAYTEYLSEEIASRTIADKPITAYSIGVKGGDVTNTVKFESDLAKIASPGKSEILTGFGNLQTTFQAIADSLEITQIANTTFTMKTTRLETGTKVRMTFDVNSTGPAYAAASTRYIEGVINVNESSLVYTFDDVTYGSGLGSAEGAGPITGVRTGTVVNFVFNNLTGSTPADESRTKQWLMPPGEIAWQINSEYSVTGATDTETAARSSIIYLVLDASTSLNPTQIGQIRDATSSFITSLYLQLIGFVPSGVSATATSSSSITVSWNPVDNASYYYIYRSTSSGGTYSYIGETSDAYYTNSSGLSAGTEYYYKVAAYNYDYGVGAQSWDAYAATKVAAPSNVTATATGSDSIRVSWDAVNGASVSGYQVYRSTSSSGTYEKAGDPSASPYTDTGLSPNTTYYYKVSASNDSGEGAQSSTYGSATTNVAAPSGVTATAAGSTSITVSWDAVNGASRYYVYRSESSGGTYTQIGSYTTATSYTNTGLSPNTEYHYKVAAYNSNGQGAQSSAASATTLVQYTVTFDADGGDPATQTMPVDSGGSIGAITYSSVSGGEWTLLSDGRRQSPVTAHGATSKVRISFTSTEANASISIQLAVSSESGCDYAFISTLDNASATYSSGYFSGSLISGEQTVTVTIPVPTAGEYFIDIGYRKDGSAVYGSDCAWFKVTDSNGLSGMPTEPTKSGSTFGGWWTAQNGGGTEFTEDTPVTVDSTVYAKWTTD
ncbi:MAG: fibronectin type III domain-containing protein [Treponema sp.]|jgi:fibronectin type 3 domain-containing protein|nr:fibronectin type III domain-containing protein [Treponema sp.]